jgi:DNA helicase HerA-like ATPase
MVGRLLESLVGDLGGTVLVLDPNSDYVQLRKSAEDADRPYNAAAKTSFAERVDVYRVPGVQGRRLTDDLVGPSKPFTVRFAALDHGEIAELAGVPSSATRIRDAISRAAQYLLDNGSPDFRPDDLYGCLQAVAGESNAPAFGPSGRPIPSANDPGDRSAARNALVYIDNLRRFGIWGYQDVPIDELLQPRRLTVVDLAGVEKDVASYVADKALREIWSRALAGTLAYPVFIVLEEAHNLVPPKGGRATHIINTIAAEGRKFKVFLIVVTQRPSKVHQDTLSQCGSQLVMRLTNPEDQRAVRSASELMSDDLLGNLPSLNTGEAIIVGPLARVPAMVRVGRRQSAEGGSDIDLVAALARASEDAHVGSIATDRMQPPPVATTVTKESYL